MKPPNPLRSGDYIVDSIPFGMGRDIVKLHHYARGSSNTAVFRHGLFHRDNPLDILGAALWIPPTAGAAKSVSADWQGVLSLSRLVIVPGMPTNAASFLIARSIRLIRRDPRWHTLLTYADEGQGHTGAIYLATNWEPRGTVVGDPVYLDEDGRQVSRKAGPRTRTNAEMLAAGYRNVGHTTKRKFIMQIREAGR